MGTELGNQANTDRLLLSPWVRRSLISDPPKKSPLSPIFCQHPWLICYLARPFSSWHLHSFKVHPHIVCINQKEETNRCRLNQMIGVNIRCLLIWELAGILFTVTFPSTRKENKQIQIEGHSTKKKKKYCSSKCQCQETTQRLRHFSDYRKLKT